MKKTILLLMLVCGIAITTQAQNKQQAHVAAAVENMRKAMISGNRADLERLASDSLTYGHSSGKLQNKTEFVDAIANKHSVFVSITLTEQTITLVKNTAIVRHKLAAQTADDGKPGTVNLGIMLVFIKEHNQWKLLARQAYKLPVL